MLGTSMRPLNLVSVCVLVAAGCGLTDSGPAEGQFCADLSRKECAAVAGKCVVFQAPACENLRRAACDQVVRAAKTAGRAYDRDRAEDCLKRVEVAFAGGVLSGLQLDQLNTTCMRAYGGSAKEFGPCQIDVDCAGGLSCDRGRCAKRTEVKANAGCANPGDTCPTGQFCGSSGGLMLCAARRDRGATCSTAEPCREGLRCASTCADAMPVGSACQPKSEAGLWAGSFEDCASNYCDPFLRRCAQGLSFASDSSSCRAYAGEAISAPDAGATPDAASPDAAGPAADAASTPDSAASND